MVTKNEFRPLSYEDFIGFLYLNYDLVYLAGSSGNCPIGRFYEVLDCDSNWLASSHELVNIEFDIRVPLQNWEAKVVRFVDVHFGVGNSFTSQDLLTAIRHLDIQTGANINLNGDREGLCMEACY